MPFWNDPKSQPKLAFKWYMSFGKAPNDVKSYTVRSFQRPSFQIAVSEYTWLNDVRFQPGVLTWNPIEIVLTDGEGKDENNAKRMYNILVGGGYNTEPGKISEIQKINSSDALGGQMKFFQIDENGNHIESWTLINPFLEAVNFGQGNYSSEEIVSIALTIRYDYALYEDFTSPDLAPIR